MKRDVLIAAFASLSMIAAAAPAAAKAAQEGEQSAQGSMTTGASAKAEKKTCKTFADTTSRMKSTRLCLTKAEWKKFEDTQK